MQQVMYIALLIFMLFIAAKFCIIVLSVAFLSIYDLHKAKKDLVIRNKVEDNYQNGESKEHIQCKKSGFKSILNKIYSILYRYIGWKVSTIPSMHLRIFLYRNVFHMDIASNVTIHYKLEIRCGYRIHIGEGTVIGDNCLLDGRQGIYLGNNVNISSNASIYTWQHDINSSEFLGTGGPVVVRDRVWLSSNTVVLPNTTIDEGAVLACGAIATKNLEKYSVYAGVPARKIAERNRNLGYVFCSGYEML